MSPPLIETSATRTKITELKFWQIQKRKVCVSSFTFSNFIHASFSLVFVGIEPDSGLSFPAECWVIQTYMFIPWRTHPQDLVHLPVAGKFFQLLPANFNDCCASHMTEMVCYPRILTSIQRYKTKITAQGQTNLNSVQEPVWIQRILGDEKLTSGPHFMVQEWQVSLHFV